MSDVDPFQVQVLAAVLLGIGLCTVLARRNLFFTLMGIELMLNAVNLSFVGFGRTLPGEAALTGQIAALFVIALAAAEACVALAMVILLVRGRDTLDSDAYAMLRE